MREGEKCRNNLSGHFLAISAGHEFMTCSRHQDQFRGRGNQLKRLFHFFSRTEAVPRAVNKKCRRLKRWEVFRTEILRALRGVQWK